MLGIVIAGIQMKICCLNFMLIYYWWRWWYWQGLWRSSTALYFLSHFDFSSLCGFKCMMRIWLSGWKGKRLFLIPGSLNVVSCVTNDLNVISCCETQRIQFSRLGAIFLPHHFLRVKQVCASANGFWIIEPRSDPTTKEKSYICHWI